MKKFVLTLFAVHGLWATDPNCPGYPMPQRELDNAVREREISFNTFSRRASKVGAKATPVKYEGERTVSAMIEFLEKETGLSLARDEL